MPRLTLALVALSAALAGGLAATLLTRDAAPDEAAIRSIVETVLAERPAPATAEPAPLSAEAINPLIEDYLMSDPRILERMSTALDIELRTAQAAETLAALETYRTQIYEDADNIILGNPEGDVTLVEMFDYNCSFCRNALPDLAALLDEDPNLRVILKEFPILSQESVAAARVGVVVARADVDYWDFHETLFTGRGQVTGQTALAAAAELGLNPVSVELDMQAASVTEAIQRSYALAQALNITGTPTYIIGDELIPGAIGLEELRGRIANMRACGSTQCDG
ncbi:DsbA family protein [Arsenicitalea aurantiaca]|uniref:DsbA family protein n=1 Tax=Arsenicitalea aurantiaca TaxID=1783274 RepID=A0A433XFT4_9HYPH|nr:DsbA family protein [Arsenicitalea aurantiaca]RUT32808.1 DsbA family protein [Arsenicitalea aurantiaca]